MPLRVTAYDSLSSLSGLQALIDEVDARGVNRSRHSENRN